MNMIQKLTEALKAAAAKAEPLYEAHVGGFSTHAAHLGSKLSSLSPMVIFYGVYNAGKSSLINAILGEEVAPVSDRPETSKVKAYQWGGCELVDTPGIDAPIAHEVISADALKRADVVIFVISTNGVFDEDIIASEIVRIISMKKSLILVLNRKSEFSEVSSADSSKLDKLESNIRLFARRAGLSDEALNLGYYYSIVNAKSALEAKFDVGKPLLLERSGIQALEALIMQVMKENAGVRVLANAVAYVETDIISPILLSLEKKIAASEGADINECFEYMRTAKREAAVLCRNEASKVISTAVEGVADGNGPAVETLESGITAVVDAIVSEALSRSVDFAMSRLGVRLELEAGRATGAGFAATYNAGGHPETSAGEDKAAEMLHVAQPADCPADMFAVLACRALKSGVRRSAGKFVIKSGLKTISKGISFMKNASIISKSTAKTLGKSVRFLGKYAGPIAMCVDALLAIFEYSKACGRDRQEMENGRTMALAAGSRKKEMRALMESYISSLILSHIDAVFSGLEAALTKALHRDEAGLGELGAARAVLNGVCKEIESLKAALA